MYVHTIFTRWVILPDTANLKQSESTIFNHQKADSLMYTQNTENFKFCY